MVRVVFMGTPDFAVPSLQALIKNQEVVGVITQPDRKAGRGRELRPPPVKLVAQESGIPVYQPKSLKDVSSARPLRDWEPDIIIVAAYGQILREHVLQLPPLGCLNIHASLLPRWRGASPIQHAILAGDQETGISLMKMDAGMDTGPVFIQRALPIGGRETASTLHDKLSALGAELLMAHLNDIAARRLKPEHQENELATYAPLIKKSDGEIDWDTGSDALDRQIRAMTPWPSAFTYWSGQLLKVMKAEPIPPDGFPPSQPGRILDWRGSIAVAAKSGGLSLATVQLAGKPSMSIDEFVRGRPEFVGSLLGS